MIVINRIKQLALPACITIAVTACGSEGSDQPAATAAQATASSTTQAASTTQHTEQNAKTQDVTAQPSTVTATPTEVSQSEASGEVVSAKPVEALSIAEGKQRYEKTCKVCHDAGLLDAPKLSAKQEWQKRLAAKGLETLQANSAKGFNKMPAQAVGDVSEAEVYAAVNYIIQSSQ